MILFVWKKAQLYKKSFFSKKKNEVISCVVLDKIPKTLVSGNKDLIG